MLYEGKVAKGVLSEERLEELLGSGKIEFPTITEKEIQDRSKADALSKTLVIGQTTWFMLQCAARAVQGLDITQLELLTVALAFLNARMYSCWWNKPLDVGVPIPVHLLGADSNNLQPAAGEPQKSIASRPGHSMQYQMRRCRQSRSWTSPPMSQLPPSRPATRVMKLQIPCSPHPKTLLNLLGTHGSNVSGLLSEMPQDTIPMAFLL